MKIDKSTIAVIEIVILWTAFIVSFQDMFKIIYNL